MNPYLFLLNLIYLSIYFILALFIIALLENDILSNLYNVLIGRPQ